ncbi:hypothetical protein MXEN_18679 [Mycobacterium xenopi RIVM700367]|uniref:Secreted protein n=1 Tax=Mycobacterium xenopi TaxID=1789 RepID=A0AAD1M0E5_MYCXE|nr:hypothetical protein [Mycobacterium xenopi]EID09997.1 hypothetical protein MXEN_18679 [Mycobacterium xenopi RIVM700367]BBU21351.1 hypothetical protein MYXE_11400 [Mycobacterium xenopi]SPX78758.1 putative secreted protein [Mycobacterium xenopi]
MTAIRKGLFGFGLAILLAAANLGITAAASRADENPPLHHVKYTLTVDHPIYADIYYLDQEPPIFSDYSHNPYQFVPNVKVDVAPNAPWTHELDLARPDLWAFFTASTGTEPGTPMFHCKLAVDGVVVVSNDGAKGVLCSIRHW